MRCTKRLLSLFLAVFLLFAAFPRLDLPVRAKEYSGECGSLTWYYNSSTGFMRIDGSGEMQNFSDSESCPWYGCGQGVKTLVIADGITSIGDFAFAKFSRLKKATIPDSVTSIGKYAFSGCTLLSDVKIPEGVTVINEATFSGCGFQRLDIPDHITSIGKYAFAGGNFLEHATLPKGLTEIPEGLFAACQYLKSVSIPAGVTSIGNFAFAQCRLLEDVKIPEAVQTIGMGAFIQCDRLVHVTIPESVTSIEYLAFQNCRRLQRLTVMNGDCEINEDVSTMCDPAQTEIIGRRDSKAERYAKRFGYKFTDYNDAYGGPDAPVNPFVDVERGEYCYAPVLWAVYHSPQITKGTDAAHFSPNAACTRGQVVTFLWRAAGCPKPAGTDNPFTDVRPGDYFYKAVLWAVEKGVTRGTSDTLFSPNDGCTRGQVVTFLWRAAGSPVPSGAGTAFADVKPGAFYEKAVAWAVEKGITRGMTETTFAPNAACTRGQVVTFLYRSDK